MFFVIVTASVEMAKTSNNRVLLGFFAILFGGVAFIAKQVVRKNWFLKEVSVDDFSVFPGVNVTVREVTTTFYDSGNLKEQLPAVCIRKTINIKLFLFYLIHKK